MHASWNRLRMNITWVALLGALVGMGAVVWVVGAHQTSISNGDLADALGDQDEFFSTVSVTCVDQSARSRPRLLRSQVLSNRYEPLCLPGTGEAPSTLFVRVHGQKHRGSAAIRRRVQALRVCRLIRAQPSGLAVVRSRCTKCLDPDVPRGRLEATWAPAKPVAGYPERIFLPSGSHASSSGTALLARKGEAVYLRAVRARRCSITAPITPMLTAAHLPFGGVRCAW